MERYESWAASLEPRAAGVSQLEIQKLAYLLQLLGVRLGLTFTRAHYGPYAHALSAVLSAMEGHQTTGFGDGTVPVLDFASIELLPGAIDEAHAVLTDTPPAIPDDELWRLVEGFESPYGMELLATAHWAAAHTDPVTSDPAVVSDRVAGWNLRKARLFTPHHVTVAMARLDRSGLLAGTLT